MNPKYPVYVISKDRPNTCITVRELELMNVPFKLVIEPQQYESYCKNPYVDPDKIITTPFRDLDKGSIPVRNYVWEHSDAERHWIIDDNIEAFYRMNKNMKPRVTSGTMFRAAEDFTDRYKNIALSGFNYFTFCKNTDRLPPFYFNTRIYSCILVNNNIPYRWRGRYNEDTDLSLRSLKDGWCTILFNAFLIGKVTSQRMKGGNTDNVYTDGDNRRKFAESLRDQHPDVVDVVWKFDRWQHKVDYRSFKKTELIKVDGGLVLSNKVNNYGMKLV